MDNGKSYNLSFLKRIAGEDENFILEMIATFKTTSAEYIDKAENYYSNQKLDALSKETHRFIPGVAFLGLKSMEEDLLKIEDYSKRKVNTYDIPKLMDEVRSKIAHVIDEFNVDFKLQ
jgi:hypothetical protein